MPAESQETVREAVGVFHDYDSLRDTIDTLENEGFDRADISLLAGESAVREKLGDMYDDAADVEDDPQAPRAAFVSKDAVAEAKGFAIGTLGYIGAVSAAGAIVASGGTVGAAVGAAIAAGGGGGLLGGWLAKWIGDQHAKYLQDQLDHGGILLWVNVAGEDKEEKAVRVLKDHAAGDVHVHELPFHA